MGLKRQKQTIQKYFSDWTYRLGLRWWKVTVYWCKTRKEVRRMFGKQKQGSILARTYADWRYATASIYINLPAFRDMEDTEIENVVIHELCHILINEMREGEMHHEERVVTQLQKAFMWTRSDYETNRTDSKT